MSKKRKHTLPKVFLNYGIDIHNIGNVSSSFDYKVEKNILESEAQRLGLISLNSLKFNILVKRKESDSDFIYKVRVHLIAELIQNCVVTLEPIKSIIDDFFEVDFTRKLHTKEKSSQFELNEEDELEISVGDRIELGELIMEHFVLALDPYPRKKGVKFNYEQSLNDLEGNPFSVLSTIK